MTEVLPQIRKTGGYIPVKAEDDEKTILAKAVQQLQRQLHLMKVIYRSPSGCWMLYTDFLRRNKLDGH